MNEPGTRSHAPHEPGAVVPCPLRQDNLIATARCVEYQVANGCHCRFALDSIKRVEQLLEEQSGEGFDEDLESHKEEVRQLRARAEQIEKARPPPAPPAKEKAMPRGVRSDGAKCGRCNTVPLGTRAKPGDLCRACRRAVSNGEATNGGGQPVPSDDVVEVLRARLEHHRSQAARIQRAIEVLEGAA